MKKYIILLFVILILSGCNQIGESKCSHKENPPNNNKNDYEYCNYGHIYGDIKFGEIPIDSLFTLPFVEVLGEPIYQSGHFFFFDNGIEVVSEWNMETESFSATHQIIITNPDLLVFNDIHVGETRYEIVSTLGEPITSFQYTDWEYDASEDERRIKYHLEKNGQILILSFWFDGINYETFSNLTITVLEN